MTPRIAQKERKTAEMTAAVYRYSFKEEDSSFFIIRILAFRGKRVNRWEMPEKAAFLDGLSYSRYNDSVYAHEGTPKGWVICI